MKIQIYFLKKFKNDIYVLKQKSKIKRIKNIEPLNNNSKSKKL